MSGCRGAKCICQLWHVVLCEVEWSLHQWSRIAALQMCSRDLCCLNNGRALQTEVLFMLRANHVRECVYVCWYLWRRE